MNLFEAHHGYWGLLIMLMGFVGIALGWHSILVWTTVIIGFITLVDDVYQHLRQRKEPGYLSPLHRWFYWLVGKLK